nr:BMP family ABC transporter substrate-binding protein [Bacilli bacterium]
MKNWKNAIVAVATAASLTSMMTVAVPAFAKTAPKLASHANFKVGLVTDTGGLNDHSFNHLAYVGLQAAQKKYGVSVSVVQSTQSSDYVPNLSTYAQAGYNLVIAVGYLMDSAVQKVAAEYPKTKFLIIDDAITNHKNVMSAIYQTQQCGYLVGVMAGLMNEQKHIKGINGKNTVAMVGGQDIPPVESYMAGFEAGVKKVDPKATVLIDWANSFSDPALGKEDALSLISRGADVIFPVAGATGTGVIEAAKQKGVFAIGVDANQNYLAPKTVMTSALKGVDISTEDAVASALSGHFKSGIQYFDLKNNGVGFAAPIKAVPVSIVKKVKSYIPLINSGKIVPPAVLNQK